MYMEIMAEKTFEERKKILYEFINDPHYMPMKQKELAILLQVAKEDREELSRALEELLSEGKISLSKRGRYAKAQITKVTGVFTSHAKGFGFVSAEGQEQDIFIGENDTGDAFLGDTVEVVLKGRGGRRPEGVITKVLSHGVKEVIGTFEKSKSFGFVVPDNQRINRDIFIPLERTRGAVTGQKVAHGVKEVIGTFEKSKSFGFVVPDNQRINRDIFIPLERTRGAVTGQKVAAEITDYGRGRRNPEGRITKIIGEASDPQTEVLSVVLAYGIPTEFPEKVLNQAERVAKEVSQADREGRLDLRGEVCVTIDGEDAKDLDDAVSLRKEGENYVLGVKEVSQADREGRLDLRGEVCVTIDGEDAKDLDDAVSLRKEGENYVLGVHIADVANYVQENSALDREALERGTSVYLSDRVIPMLPRALSNGICSLNEGEDRLALSCMMTIDEKGRITGHTLAETVICVNRRLSYTGVQKILDGDPEECEAYRELVPMLKEMASVSALLRRRRRKRGSIDFDFPETKVILDEKGHPTDIRPYERNEATRLIEDFMLAANETVAEDYYWQAQPFVYRIHEKPDAERMQKLGVFIRNFGYSLRSLAANETVAEDYYWQAQPFVYRIHEKPDAERMQKLGVFIRNFGYSLRSSGDEVHPGEIQKLLDRIAGTPEEAMLSRLTLRSMKQAKYSTDCTGHFGLAASYYCHFTSPIRRYPDLQIHRIIKENLRGRLSAERILHYETILPEAAKHSSEMERRAAEAERESVKLKKVEYMEGHRGEEYDGVISGVSTYGFYVELENTVEGLVHVNSLKGDFYEYDEKSGELRSARTGTSYRLGEKVRIRVKGTDRLCRTIDFELVQEEKERWGRMQ